MTKFLLGVLSLVIPFSSEAQTPRDSIALATAEWQITDLGAGAESHYAQIDLFDSRQSISVVSYPAHRFSTQVIHLDRKARTTSDLGKDTQADIALNGSYFNMKTLASETFVLVDKKIVGPTIPGKMMQNNGIIAVRDRHGRKIDILLCDTTGYPRIARHYRSALASGPMLVSNGKVIEYNTKDGFYTRRHPRSLIGERADGQIVMAVIDGRFKGEGEGTTIAETAYIARQLGLVDAMNLDGGGSSSLWTAKEGILNHPSDNHCFDHAGEREVVNAIVARKRE